MISIFIFKLLSLFWLIYNKQIWLIEVENNQYYILKMYSQETSQYFYTYHICFLTNAE